MAPDFLRCYLHVSCGTKHPTRCTEVLKLWQHISSCFCCHCAMQPCEQGRIAYRRQRVITGYYSRVITEASCKWAKKTNASRSLFLLGTPSCRGSEFRSATYIYNSVSLNIYFLKGFFAHRVLKYYQLSLASKEKPWRRACAYRSCRQGGRITFKFRLIFVARIQRPGVE